MRMAVWLSVRRVRQEDEALKNAFGRLNATRIRAAATGPAAGCIGCSPNIRIHIRIGKKRYALFGIQRERERTGGKR